MIPFLSLITALVGVVGLYLAYLLYTRILELPDGNERMREVAAAIRTGADSFLREEARYLLVFVAVVFVIVLWGLGMNTAVAFAAGAGCSLLAGFFGMKSATAANVRTAQAAAENRATDALMVAFDGGAVMGLTVGSLGVLGLGLLFILFGSPDTFSPMIGFGMGASSVALFARIGGGIYTKAADVGSDLVGKVEAGIPEDDPRNPGVIADNVGDNVGDVAGMGADIFESFVAIMIGCIAIGATLANPTELARITAYVIPTNGDASGIAYYQRWLMLTPLVQGVLGLIASYASMKLMQQFKYGEPASALRSTTLASVVIYLALAFVFCLLTPINLNLWLSMVVGSACGLVIGFISEYYTASKPVYRIVEASKTGAATCVISGVSVGLTSVAMPLAAIVVATALSHYFGGIYGSALAGVAMLATAAMTMTIDAYGPIADNAGGISEMSHLGPETRAITDRLDAVGNTTAAIGKGFAIGASGLAALSLFAAFAEAIHIRHPDIALSLLDSRLMIGVFIGAMIPGIVASLTMESVGRAAGLMVTEIRRQFKEIPGLLEGREGVKPDVSTCVAISTKAALREMLRPGIIAVSAPVLVGWIFGASTLAGFLLGVTIVGMVLGIFMANAGGAWDNAKKYIEQGLVEGEKKGSDAHKAAVVGDTVGDPFKDTSGPAMNILIKLTSMLALLIAPLL